MMKLSILISLALCGTLATDAQAQVVVNAGVDVDADVVVAPPDAYIATVQPEYYDGVPVYYYNNYWYYRDRWGRWGYYRNEPEYLRGRRAYWAGRGYDHYRPEYWHHPYAGGYRRGGAPRGGYVRGGYAHGGYTRGGYGGGGYAHAGAGRYHYHR